LWRQDRWKPIVAGAVNLGSNILFVLFLPDAYKLDGVIFSTIIGFAFIQIPWESHVVFTAFFGKAESRAYWRSYAGFAAFTVVMCVAAWLVACAVPLHGIPGLFAKAFAAMAVASLCMALAFRNDISDMLGKFRRRN
jgi:peptidoglycan biosynthesis protein MviN/MurJ (putative lipid II flippase)